MAKYMVQQSGPLKGEVVISGAKNAVLPLMAAALLAEDTCVIRDVPKLRDVSFMKELLTSLSSEIEELEENVLSVSTKDILSTEAQFELVNKMRASILVMGPLLARKGRARIPHPGGCAIGSRPIDLHLKGLEALGAVITSTDTYVEAVAGAQGLVGYSSNRILRNTIRSFPKEWNCASWKSGLSERRRDRKHHDGSGSRGRDNLYRECGGGA